MRQLVRRATGPLPSPRRPCSRWPRGATCIGAKEIIHAHQKIRPGTPPPPALPPARLTAVWTQLPPARRQKLQRLLADMLARTVTDGAARPREERHDDRDA
jgi:hypothetical protein